MVGKRCSYVKIVDVDILRHEGGNANVVVHIVLSHLEQVLPCQLP